MLGGIMVNILQDIFNSAIDKVVDLFFPLKTFNIEWLDSEEML